MLGVSRILLIDDDEAVRELVRPLVQYLGYELDCAADGETGLVRALAEEYALVLLDLSPPRLGGHEVCRRLRAKNPLVPIIMLGAQAEVVDKVLGLSVGADDYLTKPFGGAELCARI